MLHHFKRDAFRQLPRRCQPELPASAAAAAQAHNTLRKVLQGQLCPVFKSAGLCRMLSVGTFTEQGSGQVHTIKGPRALFGRYARHLLTLHQTVPDLCPPSGFVTKPPQHVCMACTATGTASLLLSSAQASMALHCHRHSGDSVCSEYKSSCSTVIGGTQQWCTNLCSQTLAT